MIFGQLSAFAYNMLIFMIPKSEIKSLMQKFGESNSLPDFAIKDLLVFVSNY